MPTALQGIESTCANVSGKNPEVMVVYNRTDDVLVVSPTVASAAETIQVVDPAATPFPSWDDLEIVAQTQVVTALQTQESQGQTLIPVGGAALVFLNGTYPPLGAYVEVDSRASALSYGAQLLTGFVADNLRESRPVLSYASSITSCANAAYPLWQNLTQSADAAATMITALRTVQPCTSLAEQVQANRAEVLAAVSAKSALEATTLEPDLAKVADTAGASSWESTIGELATEAADIYEIAH